MDSVLNVIKFKATSAFLFGVFWSSL